MSILLIGERNRLGLHKRVNQIDRKEFNELIKEKRTIKEQYRSDLLKQMDQNQQRRRNQRQKQIQEDERHQRLFYEQVEKQRQRSGDSSGHKYNARTNKNNREGLEYQTISKGNQSTLPNISFSKTPKNKTNRYETEPVQDYERYQGRSRLKTENMDRDRSDRGRLQFSNYLELQSSEKRQMRLQEELQHKLEEVYSLMQESANVLNCKEEIDKIQQRLTPIRLHFNKRYKTKYPEGVEELSNPQVERDYFKLPNISTNFKQIQQRNEESEAGWRSWYAREKMQELESRYRKELNIVPRDIRLQRSNETPDFGLRRY